MITVTLTQEEVAERSQALARYATKLADLADEEEGIKADYKQTIADVKKRRLEISGELRRLSRAVRLGVEERTTQRVLFDEEKRLEEFRQEARRQADERIAEGEELIEQQRQAEAEAEQERERLHKEAVANWRREEPASSEEEENEQEGIYICQGCEAEVDFDLSATDGLCARCWTPDAIKDPVERAAFIAKHKEELDLPREADKERWTIPATINQALHAALHHVEGAAERWRSLQENGAADGELKAMIGREFGIGGGATQYGGYRFKGGKSPEFSWPGYADQSQAQTIKGKRLLTKVRDVMSIGAPGQSSDPNADHSAAYPDDEIEAAPDPDGGDDFTAPICDECKRIDGGHTQECSKSNALRFDDYLAYARAHYKSNHQSHARKMELTKLKDKEVREWKQQQAGKGVEAEPEPKKKKRKKLSPVEAAIDR